MSQAERNARWAGTLIASFAKGGITHAVLCPGSRNTPLVLALESHTQIQCHTIIDERVAGFFALGLARVTGTPTLLCSTSGSAMTHFMPAVVEAFASRIPLIVLSADRPPELQGCGAPQAMAQDDLFGRHVRLAVNPGIPVDGDLAWLGTLAQRVVHAACGTTPGPAHMNLPFPEPLWMPGVTPAVTTELGPRISAGRPMLDPAGVAALAERLRGVSRGLVFWGPTDPVCGDREASETLSRDVTRLAEALGWPVLSDATAAIRGKRHAESVQIGAADLLTRSEAFSQRMQPELVLRFGGVATSKPVARWMSVCPAIVVDPGDVLRDPYHHADTWVTADPTALIPALAEALSGPTRNNTEWLAEWRRADDVARATLADVVAGETPWCGTVARQVSRALPDGGLLHVASSLPIRAIDGFVPRLPADITVTANRGVNGIDGTLSTALGQARAWSHGPACVLLGDLAYQHDLGALACLRESRITVVVIDNGGGGIFDHLPISRHSQVFEPRFITPQGLDLVAITRAFGVAAFKADTEGALEQLLADRIEAPEASVIVASVDRAHDLASHERVREAVRAALARRVTR